ncbi:MAG: heme-binding protein [Lachnospiraceae bacterium]
MRETARTFTMKTGSGEKFNTVKTLEKSSLYTYMLLRKNEETMENLFLDEKNTPAAAAVSRFRVEEVGVIGAILVSGLDHVSDHDFIVKCVSRYLHIDEVPRIRGDILS